MNNASGNLTLELEQLASALNRVEQRLRLEPEPDGDVLNEFRHAVDNTRLTAWSVSELIHAHRSKKDRQAAVSFAAAERLRRFEQLIKTLCRDIEDGIITMKTTGMQSLSESVGDLQRLTQSTSDVSR